MAGAPATEVVTEIAGKDVGAGLFGDPLRPGRHRLVQDRVAPDVDSGPGRVGDSYFRAADGVTLDADRKVRLVAPADRLDPGIEISHPGRMPRPHRNADLDGGGQFQGDAVIGRRRNQAEHAIRLARSYLGPLIPRAGFRPDGSVETQRRGVREAVGNNAPKSSNRDAWVSKRLRGPHAAVAEKRQCAITLPIPTPHLAPRRCHRNSSLAPCDENE